MRLGREPFSRIMAAVSALDDDQALRLRTIFEPVPLFTVLGKRGFQPRVECRTRRRLVRLVLAPGASWRGAASLDSLRSLGMTIGPRSLGRRGASRSLDEGPASSDDERREHEVWLDVRGLEPPQPMLRTLAALETLPDGHELVQVNVRVPQLLLPVLAERGYACEVDESQADRVLVRIWRPARR